MLFQIISLLLGWRTATPLILQWHVRLHKELPFLLTNLIAVCGGGDPNSLRLVHFCFIPSHIDLGFGSLMETTMHNIYFCF